MYNKVELCGVNTGQLPVLTEAEKRQLLTLAHAGDKAARARMVEGNLRLVLSVVQRFAQRGENLDDLFQVGCIGLIKAIDNFDPAQPVRFSTYGVPMIIGEIRRFLRDNNALRVSRTLRDTAYPAPQVALGLVAGQHGAHLPVQRRADAAQPHGNVLVHGGLATPERSRRCTHRGVVGGNVLPQLHGALFRIGFHILPPCVPALQWYNIRAAGADYVCGLDFLSPGAYTVGGHKNRGAVRLRSA